MKKIFFGLMVGATAFTPIATHADTGVLVTPKQATAYCPTMLAARQREGYCEITKPYSREIRPWTPDISDLPNKWVVCAHMQLQ
jgi:hypothetical protein